MGCLHPISICRTPGMDVVDPRAAWPVDLEGICRILSDILHGDADTPMAHFVRDDNLLRHAERDGARSEACRSGSKAKHCREIHGHASPQPIDRPPP